MKTFIFLWLALMTFSQGKEIGTRSYKGYQVLTVEVGTSSQFEIIKSLYENDICDFWTTPRTFGATDLMVAPDMSINLKKLFLTNAIKFEVKIKDVEGLVLAERESNNRASEGTMSWTAYHKFSEIEEWLNNLDSPIATVSTIGTTYENRNIYVVKFSTGGAPKKSVLIDANIHAREWITGATATWIINELTTNPDDYANILAQIDIYVIPLLNVDGYEWSRTQDRMWRKTRSVRPGSTCIGCDPNRNFEFMFGGEGTSSNPCSDTYTGSRPFSELETSAIHDFVVNSEATGIKFYAYMTLHSYSQVWLLPWGHTSGMYPSDYEEQLSLGKASIQALYEVSGTVYQTGQGADLLYGVGGASDDWAKNHGIKYAATIEMRDTGKYGFLLPANQIIPNSKEVWAALQVVFRRVIEIPA